MPDTEATPIPSQKDYLEETEVKELADRIVEWVAVRNHVRDLDEDIRYQVLASIRHAVPYALKHIGRALQDWQPLYDAHDNELILGSRVRMEGWKPTERNGDDPPLTAEQAHGHIIAVSDPDADFDDNLGRGVYNAPKVKVLFDDGQEEEFHSFARVCGYSDTSCDHICEDLEYVGVGVDE